MFGVAREGPCLEATEPVSGHFLEHKANGNQNDGFGTQTRARYPSAFGAASV